MDKPIFILSPEELKIDFYGNPLEDGYSISDFPILPANCEYRLLRATYKDHKYVGLDSFFMITPEDILAESMIEKAREWMRSIIDPGRSDKGMKFLENIAECRCPDCGRPNKLFSQMRGQVDGVRSFEYFMNCVSCGYTTNLKIYMNKGETSEFPNWGDGKP